MHVAFEVSTHHLIRLCDAVLSEELEPQSLEAIAYCIIASDSFFYDADSSDGQLVSETLSRWDSPEINFPLTIANVRQFRERLLGGQATLANSPDV
jgi:hypothetical protein